MKIAGPQTIRCLRNQAALTVQCKSTTKPFGLPSTIVACPRFGEQATPLHETESTLAGL
jgi:hypothetical protein